MSKERILSLPCWDSSGELEELPGGITNRNYKVVSAAGNRMARVCEDHRVLGIDRRNEVACQGPRRLSALPRRSSTTRRGSW